MKARHVPGLLAQTDVELVTVCNRRRESTAKAAQELGIPRTASHWQEVVDDPEVDAIVIGTWPYLHCPITLAALEAGKHVLTEARMSMNAAEAHQMLAASRKHPKLVCQIVPSPFGLRGHEVVLEWIRDQLGELREVSVFDFHGGLADKSAPLSWRQNASLSGLNVLTLGILHETLLRWVPPPTRVLAQAHAFIPRRIDPESGVERAVGTPDSVQVLATLENGARVVYQFSGVTPFGASRGIHLIGTDGILCYDLLQDKLRGASRQLGSWAVSLHDLEEIPVPPEKERSWRVEEEFVEAIRKGTPIEMTDFVTGVAYAEFTEAVARSAETGNAVDLPLDS